ncbi:hypothetical protein BC827DRAFT_1158392 [Russula dissimulans]|nr:hypothetical protein BC827DRAFT_1158392 [Russula dissimulans]
MAHVVLFSSCVVVHTCPPIVVPNPVQWPASGDNECPHGLAHRNKQYEFARPPLDAAVGGGISVASRRFMDEHAKGVHGKESRSKRKRHKERKKTAFHAFQIHEKKRNSRLTGDNSPIGTRTK